jgi:hypothetical protein
MWTVVVALALARVLTHVTGLTVWAVLIGQVAMVLTGWLILERVMIRVRNEAMSQCREMNDRSVERIATRLAEVLRDQTNVSSLR